MEWELGTKWAKYPDKSRWRIAYVNGKRALFRQKALG
jgi:hypothetical protein